MPDATFHFPDDFRWGVATAAHQVEGHNTDSDWWQWEQQPGTIANGDRSGSACDWWENAELDFDHAAAMGIRALRLSVDWSRVEPEPGAFSDAALSRYLEMLDGLRSRGIEPMVTLHHFANPLWLAEDGGWTHAQAIDRFARFVERVVEALAPACDLWCTVNEPNVYAYQGYLAGVWPPGESNRGLAVRVMRNLLKGHAAAYRTIHAVQPEARVGLAHNMRLFDPAKPGALGDRLVAGLLDRTYNRALLRSLERGIWALPLGLGPAFQLRDTLDWIGLNYYTRDLVAFDRRRPGTFFSRRFHSEDAEMLDGGFGVFYPEGILRCLERLAPLGLPIFITENGIPDQDDDQRPRYIITHLHRVWHAIQRCYPIMGYYHWTLTDNFEWAEGWSLRFGLIELDRRTQARVPRASAELYQTLIRENAITPDLIDTYAPSLRPRLLPGAVQ